MEGKGGGGKREQDGSGIHVARGEAWGPSPQREWKKFAHPFQLCKRDKYIRESLMFSNSECKCDQIYAVEMSNMTDLWLSGAIFSTSKYSKTRFRPGLRPGPRWGSLRRSPRPPSRLGRGAPPPHSLPPRRLRRLDLGAFGASVVRPPNTNSWLRYIWVVGV